MHECYTEVTNSENMAFKQCNGKEESHSCRRWRRSMNIITLRGSLEILGYQSGPHLIATQFVDPSGIHNILCVYMFLVYPLEYNKQTEMLHLQLLAHLLLSYL